MVAQKPVSIGWQIVFVFISPLNLWSFYRIKKLRKAALYVYIPSSIIQLLLWFLIGNQVATSDIQPSVEGIMLLVNIYAIFAVMSSIGFIIFSIYLMVKWSRQWNLKFQSENS